MRANKEQPAPATGLRHILRTRCGRTFRLAFLALSACLLALLSWVLWGGWPQPATGEPPWQPDAILVLGGGNGARPHLALRLAAEYPDAAVVVTGDSGLIVSALVAGGLPIERISHEKKATSTDENARFTRGILEKGGHQDVLLVTNWFHVPRAMALFARHQPERRFHPVHDAKPARLDDWHRYASRRERLAALHHLLRHGIWVF
jgi:uncharacterized SAM-binding protein YcdF (DUF218 family)